MTIRGFTLLELMVVLAILALASSVIIPRINSDGVFFNTKVRELTTLLKQNRRLAILKKQHRLVKLVVSEKGTKTKSKKSNTDLWSSERIHFTWSDDSVKEVIDKTVIIHFLPQGGATGGKLLLQYENQQTKLELDSFTGKISLSTEND